MPAYRDALRISFDLTKQVLYSLFSKWIGLPFQFGSEEATDLLGDNGLEVLIFFSSRTS